MKLKGKRVMITGASKGLGRALAVRFAAEGADLALCARSGKALEELHNSLISTGVRVVAVQCDVANSVQVQSFVEKVAAELGDVDVLINNAGYVLSGAAEHATLEQAKAQFETNFFGVLRLTNAILPGMRQAGDGRIVNISSVVGFLPAPYMGIYAASKHALEGYTETLDHEVRRFGVRAILVQPAYTKSKFSGNARFARVALELYAAERKRVNDLVEQSVEQGDDPRVVADAVCQALTAKSPRLRYPVGKGVALSRMRRFVPTGIFDKSFRKQFQLD